MKKSIDGALIGRENLFSLKRHFETEHENVLSVMYVNPTKDIHLLLFIYAKYTIIYVNS